LQLEYGYNHFEGFYRAIWFYGLAFVVLLIAHLRNRGHALRNIGTGEEITAEYLHGLELDRTTCRCQSVACVTGSSGSDF